MNWNPENADQGDRIYRYHVNLGLAFVKFDFAGNKNHFSLDHSKLLMGRCRGPGCNESGEVLIGYSPPKIETGLGLTF
jgi:hypothetical protein